MKKQKNVNSNFMKIIIPIIIFLIGLGIFVYPSVSSWLAGRNQTKVINEYQSVVEAFSEEDMKIQEELVSRYNTELIKADDVVEGESYVDYINAGTILGYINIEKINVNLPIYQGCGDNVLRFGVGHIEKSSLPSLDKPSHIAITGHRGLPNSVLFTDLDKMEMGDKFYISFLGKKYNYEVDQIKTVEPTETDDLRIHDEDSFATLITCTPYSVNSHRLLVRGKFINVENSNEEVITEENTEVEKDVEEEEDVEETVDVFSKENDKEVEAELKNAFSKYSIVPEQETSQRNSIILIIVLGIFIAILVAIVVRIIAKKDENKK